MTLHREGTSIIIGTLIIVGILTYLNLTFVTIPVIKWLLMAIFLVFTYLIVQFFRLPFRKVSAEEQIVISPCDGKVVVIEEVFEPEFLKEKVLQVSVFMSPVNVHANWFPISGKVVYDKYHPGKFLVAWHPKSSTENERTTICVENSKGQKVLFRQVAGALAKRIKYYTKAGEAAEQGSEFGFIKFGSRVDLYLPLDSEIIVKIGDKVSGITSQIARLS
ncbi:MAG: phosphatidylserine decarboxylase family protein [Bacteroidota bacterium]